MDSLLLCAVVICVRAYYFSLVCVASINQRERACSHATRRFLSCTLTQRCDGADVVWSHNLHLKSHVASLYFFLLFSLTLVSTSRITMQLGSRGTIPLEESTRTSSLHLTRKTNDSSSRMSSRAETPAKSFTNESSCGNTTSCEYSRGRAHVHAHTRDRAKEWGTDSWTRREVHLSRRNPVGFFDQNRSSTVFKANPAGVCHSSHSVVF